MNRPKVIYTLLCEHHIESSAKKDSYLNVFDSLTVTARNKDGSPVRVPLEKALYAGPIVVVFEIRSEPGAHEYELDVCDPDGASILPTFKGQLRHNPKGKNSLHVRFPQGIPLTKPGDYKFHLKVDGHEAGVASLEVNIQAEEAASR